MGLIDAFRNAFRPREISRYTLSEYLQWVMHYGGEQDLGGYRTTYKNLPAEPIGDSFADYVNNAYRANGIVYACEMVRVKVFAEVRFQFQAMRGGRPAELFGNRSLSILERPAVGSPTGDMLTRMILDADLAGNWFGTIIDGELVRMRPDWVDIVLAPRYGPGGGIVGQKKVGYVYYEGGKHAQAGIYGQPKTEPEVFLADEVAHFAPSPDPLAAYRGMSWLTPVVREIQADSSATRHKQAWYQNAATPNVAVSLAKEITPEQFEKFVEKMDAAHKGPDSAGKTLYTAGGADVTVIGADMKQMDFKIVQGAGEPLALDTPIPTPTGWTTMGEISIGDQVIGRDGRPANVLGVSPVHVGRECFRVTLRDGASIVADASHIWAAIDRGSAKRREKTYTTRELFELHQRSYPNGVGGHRIALPAAPVVELPESDLLVDPYVLGAWLGDGQTAGAAICGATDDLKFIAHEIEARGYTTTRWSTAEDKVDVIGVPGGLLHALRALGVLGDKHIPAPYLRASVEQRLDLLRGLMDTDGSIDDTQRGGCEYSSKDERLARQVVELIRSLGYRVSIKSRKDARSRTGLQWRVHFRVAQDRMPFLLPRKVDRALASGDPHFSNQRSIVAIEPVESVAVRCIAVDTSDHLFLAGDGFVPTHNTRIAAAAGVHPVVAALSEGMQGSSLNAGNFNAAKRAVGQITFRPLWRNAAGSLELLVPPPDPDTSRLWYDARDVDFLREDEKDAAEIRAKDAQTLRTLSDAGAEWDAAVEFIDSGGDITTLKGRHSGLFSVQLQPPNSVESIPVERSRVVELISAGWRPAITNGRLTSHA